MKVGQKVKHLLSEEVLTIRKINGNVAVCEIKPYKSNGVIIDVAICLIINLKTQ